MDLLAQFHSSFRIVLAYKEADDIKGQTDEEDKTGDFPQPVEQGDLVLYHHEVHGIVTEALQVDLQDACAGKEQGDEYHGDGHQPERPHFHALGTCTVAGFTTTHERHGVGDHRQYDHDISAIESHVTVGCSDLGTVSVVVHGSQGVQEAPYAGAEEGHDRSTQSPQDSCLVGVVAATLVHHVERIHGHHEEGDGLHG